MRKVAERVRARRPAKATSSSAKGPSRGRHVGLSPALRSSVSKEAVVRIIQALKEQNAQLFENPFHWAYKSLQARANPLFCADVTLSQRNNPRN